MELEQIIIAILIIINVTALLLMGNDKHRSLHGDARKRISEGYIFFIAALFGSVGVYLGMLLFRHKTKKWYFMLGVPLLMIENAATLYLAKEFFL
ncbi:MAG: hypothetical protein RL097_91 [Candidatus Parcubacteria bacterium]|jgi:uncharacterized membrane protein YsdA (DUF1294 family)